MAAPGRTTIVAVASPPGRGVRALVRASGPGVRAAARAVLGAEPVRRGVTVHARARLLATRGSGDGAGAVSGTSSGKPGDDRRDDHRDDIACPVIALWMESGASFTGEDSLEISCVGAPALAARIADALVEGARAGGFEARLARRGEFAFRAHLAGRLSVDEAESIAARIASTTDAELAAADELAAGATGARAAEILAATAEVLALVEAGIDFTDQEDVVAIAPAALAARADRLAADCAALRGAQASSHAHAVPLIVLAGAPNAGKSTLFNTLLGRPRTIASELAGTTRDAIVERVALGAGLEADLADLAGLEADLPRPADLTGLERYPPKRAADPGHPIAANMQRRAREMLAAADVVVRCTPCGARAVEVFATAAVAGDPRVPVGGDAPAPDIIEVSTMSDRGDPPAAGALAVSARTGQGVAALRAALAAHIRRDRALRRARLTDILPRHDAAFAAAESALREAAGHARTSGSRLDDAELVASLLRSALDALGEVAGPMHPDDVLGLVFSRFCIGK